MKAFRTLCLLVLVLGVGAYIYWVDSEKQSTPEREQAQRRAFSLDPDLMDFVHIRRPEYELGLRRVGEEWFLSSPRDVMANQAAVRQTLSRLRALSRGELITPSDMRERGQTLADFGLAVPVAVLVLEDSRGSREYRIGNPNPLGNALYVKEESSQNVMLISSDLMEILPLRADAFRDRRIMSRPANFVRAMSFLSPGRLVRLDVQGDQWFLSEPFRFPAQQDRVQGMIEQLTTARIERFLLPEEVGGEPFGRDEDLVTLRVQFTGSAPTLEIQIGNRVPGEPNFRYARFAGQEGVFVVSEGVRSLALTELLALQKLKILPVEAEQILGFTVRGPEGAERIEVVRSGQTWMLRRPMTAEASKETAGLVLDVWTLAMIEERHPLEQASELLYTFELDLDPSVRHVPTSFRVYADSELPSALWVHPEGMDELWRIFPDQLRHVPLKPLAYLSRNVLSFNPEKVIRFQRQHPEGLVTLLREAPGESWQSDEGEPGIKAEALDQVLKRFGKLHATRLLARGSVQLSEWGLDEAPYRLSFGLGGDKPESRTVWVAPHAEWGYVATVQGQDMVFALPESIREVLDLPLTRSLPEEVEADESNGTDS